MDFRTLSALAELTAQSYFTATHLSGRLPEGWRYVTPTEMGMTLAIPLFGPDGFYSPGVIFGQAYVAYNQSTNQVALVFRGTDPPIWYVPGIDTVSDAFLADTSIAMGQLDNTLIQFLPLIAGAKAFAAAMGASLLTTGHSLGGALAELLIRTDADFNVGAGFGSPGLPFEAMPGGQDFVHVSREQDFVGADLFPSQHLNPSIWIDDETFDSDGFFAQHSHELYEIQLERMAASPLFDQIGSQDLRIRILRDGVENVVGAESLDGVDYLLGGNLADTIDLRASNQSGRVDGGTGVDYLFGSAYADQLSGGGQADHLSGGGGDDYLWGGSNSDNLEGGADNDHLFGGGGGDRYHVGVGQGYDIIDDQGGGAGDVLVLYTGSVAAVFDYSWFTADGDDLLIRIPNSSGVGFAIDIRIRNMNSMAGRIETVELRAGDGTVLSNAWNLINLWAGLPHTVVTPPPAPAPSAPSGGFSSGDDSLTFGAGNDLFASDGRGMDTVDAGDGDDRLILDYSWSTTNVEAYADWGVFSARNQPFSTPGGNVLTARNVESVVVFGGTGNDELGGLVGDDILVGNDGDDNLAGFFGNDILLGGAGNDSIVSGLGVDWIDGGGGADYASVDLSQEIRNVHFVFSLVTTMTGFTFVNGTHVQNVERFGLTTGAGDDSVYFDAQMRGINGWGAGEGFDRLELDLSSVTEAIATDSRFYGGDLGTITFGRRQDGFALDQFSFRGIEHLIIHCGSGDDRLLGINGDNEFYGGAGADVLIGFGGDDILWGEDGDDGLQGGAGDDDLRGGGGNDHLQGGSGDNDLRGGDGNDEIWTNPGSSRIDGGAGIDRLVFDFSAETGDQSARFVSGSAASAAFMGLQIVNLETLTLTTGQGDDALEVVGLVGDQNAWYAGAGDDRLTADLSDFSQAIDVRYWSSASGRIGIGPLGGGPYSHMFYFNEVEAITIIGGSAADTLQGGGGDDVFEGRDGADQLAGNAGVDLLDGGDGSDTLSGGADNDILVGGVGYDSLLGGAGSDILIGGDDGDYLNGGGGSATAPDYLFGGAGDDLYVVNSGMTGPQDLVDEGEGNPALAGLSSDFDTIFSEGALFWDYYSVGEDLRIHRAEGGQIVGGKNVTFKYFVGGSGNDVILTYGRSSNVEGGAGTDAISFGLYGLDESYDGVNTLVMRPGDGMDYLYEFESGVDKIDLTAFGYGLTGAQWKSFLVDVENGDNDYCFLYLGQPGQYLVFVGLTSSQIQAGDFLI